MRKAIGSIIFGLLALLLLQGFSLERLYQDFRKQTAVTASAELKVAIEKELSIRRSSDKKDPHNLQFEFKGIEDMTKEEFDSLNRIDNLFDKIAALPDTPKDGPQYTGDNMQELFLQSSQDALRREGKPIRVAMLDTLYNIALSEKLEGAGFLIQLSDSTGRVLEESNHRYAARFTGVTTERFPIGQEQPQYICAKVSVPPSLVIQHLFYAFIISLLIIGVVAYCFHFLLRIIHRTRLELKEREESVDGVIHDLKKPLNGVFSLLDFMQQHTEEEEIRQFTQDSKKQIRKLTDMIESMLQDLRNEFRNVTLVRTEVEVPELLRQIERELRPSFEGKAYRFEIVDPERWEKVQTDAVRLDRSLRNLIENALKYADAGVEVRAVCCQTEEEVQIAISDTGWGIPRKAQKRIGKRFFRVKRPGMPQPDGYGIGLNNVRRLVREMGGKLTFTSEEGKGSTFIIHLPRTN